jgi:hypothetical protein
MRTGVIVVVAGTVVEVGIAVGVGVDVAGERRAVGWLRAVRAGTGELVLAIGARTIEVVDEGTGARSSTCLVDGGVSWRAGAEVRR